MIRSLFPHRSADKSFLPEDYIARRAERRTSILSVILFCFVMLGVTAAFFVSNRELNDVRQYQKAINTRYAQAAKDLETLKLLEEVESGLLRWAEVTTALYEKVPRSIIMAELINRMPRRATLLEITLNSRRLDKPLRSSRKQDDGPSGKSLSNRAKRGDKDAEADKEEEVEISAPSFESHIIIVGVVPQHEDVAEYVAALHQCRFLSSVELIFTELTTIEDTELMKFRIEADIDRQADARQIAPLASSRDEATVEADPLTLGFDEWDLGSELNLNGSDDQ